MVCQFCWPAGCLRYGHPREPALQALLGSQVPAPDSDSTFPALFLTSPLQKTSSLGFAQQSAQLGSSHCDKEQSTLCGVSPGVQLYHRSSHCSLCLRRPVGYFHLWGTSQLAAHFRYASARFTTSNRIVSEFCGCWKVSSLLLHRTSPESSSEITSGQTHIRSAKPTLPKKQKALVS